MNKAKNILLIMGLVATSLVHANADPELEKLMVTEHKTYKDFKENFQFIVGMMGKEGSGASDGNISDSHWFCVHNQQLIKMFTNNQKYKNRFNQEFSQELYPFDDALKGFKKFDQDQKETCETAQVEYDKI